MALGELLALGVLVVAVRKRQTQGPAVASDATGYVNGQAVDLDLVPIDGAGHRMRRDAGMAFLAMQQQATIDGCPLAVDSAFRTQSEQQVLYDAYKAGKGALAAPPGYSNHQGGVAVDVDTTNGTNKQFRWLNAHAFVYGFRRTVSSEPWHWEFSV